LSQRCIQTSSKCHAISKLHFASYFQVQLQLPGTQVQTKFHIAYLTRWHIPATGILTDSKLRTTRLVRIASLNSNLTDSYKKSVFGLINNIQDSLRWNATAWIKLIRELITFCINKLTSKLYADKKWLWIIFVDVNLQYACFRYPKQQKQLILCRDGTIDDVIFFFSLIEYRFISTFSLSISNPDFMEAAKVELFWANNR